MIPTQNQTTPFSWKETLISCTVAAACLVLFFLFPSEGLFETTAKSLFFLLVIPLLYITIVLKRPVREFGVTLHNASRGFFWSVFMLVLSLLAFFALFQFTPLKTVYSVPQNITDSFWIFLLYELVLMNMLFFFQEFFWKGFLLFTWREKLRFSSVFLSSGIYLVLFLLTKRPDWHLIILSFTGSVTAYKSQSFLYAWFMGILFLVLVDAYLIYLSHNV